MTSPSIIKPAAAGFGRGLASARRAGAWLADARMRLVRATNVLRRIIGAPDYSTYLAHRRRYYPTCPVLTEKEFYQQRLEDRYARPGSRCC